MKNINDIIIIIVSIIALLLSILSFTKSEKFGGRNRQNAVGMGWSPTTKHAVGMSLKEGEGRKVDRAIAAAEKEASRPQTDEEITQHEKEQEAADRRRARLHATGPFVWHDPETWGNLF